MLRIPFRARDKIDSAGAIGGNSLGRAGNLSK
jgi:hypothetical protein